MSEPFVYQNNIAEWLLENICFSLRIDIPPRPNIPYNSTKFSQDVRHICYETNLKLLGKSRFRKVRKQKKNNEQRVRYKDHNNEYEYVKDRFFLLSFEESKERSIENHYHLLCHVPVDFRDKTYKVISTFMDAFGQYHYNPLISNIYDLEGSVKYNSKETHKEWNKPDIQKWFLSYQ